MKASREERRTIKRILLDMHASVHDTAQKSCADAIEELTFTIDELAILLDVHLPEPESYDEAVS